MPNKQALEWLEKRAGKYREARERIGIALEMLDRLRGKSFELARAAMHAAGPDSILRAEA